MYYQGNIKQYTFYSNRILRSVKSLIDLGFNRFDQLPSAMYNFLDSIIAPILLVGTKLKKILFTCILASYHYHGIINMK